MKLVLIAAGTALIVLTLLSLVRSTRWWIRSADFPRLQIAVALAVVGSSFLIYYDRSSALDGAFGLLLLASFGYQCFRIFPYTPVAPRQVVDAASRDGARSIRLLISNVRMENRRDEDFLGLVRDCDPDLILALETDSWWDERLSALDGDYPHSIKCPQDNYYGMHLFSKLELRSPAVRHLVESDVPSIRTEVILRSGDQIEFFGLHPRPPEPRQDTEERDAELVIVGRQAKKGDRPAIVAGDLNDVAWSDTTRLFQRISGMLDPRRGRGMFNTFHADYPMFRWPLDHVFHDETFALVRLQRLRPIGSDHFPVLVELLHDPSAPRRHKTPEPHSGDLEEAQDLVAQATGAKGHFCCNCDAR